MYIQSYDLKTAQELMDFVAPWNKKMSEFIFRGHSNENYELLPMSLREHEFEKICSISPRESLLSRAGERESAKSLMECELYIIREFYKLSDLNGLHVPLSPEIRRQLYKNRSSDILDFTNNFPNFEWLPEKLWELAALTQHYGLPTRLLDWTYDVYVAAYFASRPTSDAGSDRLCIWGLNRNQVEIAKLIGDKDIPLNFITPHYKGNPNITAQKGLFTHFTDNINYTKVTKPDRTPLDARLKPYVYENIYKSNEQHMFIKITLPNSEAASLFDLLKMSGYGTARLFPGYDGVAQQLLEKRN